MLLPSEFWSHVPKLVPALGNITQPRSSGWRDFVELTGGPPESGTVAMFNMVPITFCTPVVPVMLFHSRGKAS